MGSQNGPEKGQKRPVSSVSGMQFAGAGFQFTAMVLVSAFLGILIDQEIGTSPWLLIVTVFFGSALGFYSLYRNLMKGQRLGDRRQTTERRDKPE